MRLDRVVVGIILLCLGGCLPERVVSTPGPLPEPGSRIRYTRWPDTASFTAARLVSLDANSMVFERRMTRPPELRFTTTMPTHEIAALQVRIGGRGHAAQGLLIGAAAGLILGTLEESQSSSSSWNFTPPAGVVAFVGGLMGLGIGASIRSSTWAPVLLSPPRQPSVTSSGTTPPRSGITVRFSLPPPFR
jgi:hypothetical protein